jgi:hypothetical protein
MPAARSTTSHSRGGPTLWAALLSLPLLSLVACGAGSSSARGARHQDNQEPRAPLTDQDPDPFRPQPNAARNEDGAQALSVTSHVDNAVQVALAFLSAVRDADMTRARDLMADQMFRLGERDFYRPMSASVALVQLQRAAARTRPAGGRPAPTARLVQLQDVEVTPPRPSTVEAAQRLQPGDSLVTFPVTPEGRVELARWYPGWSARVRILVRTSGTPRVIGF